VINPNLLDLNLLRVFEALLRDKSVSTAADRLGLTQPAISNALNRLRAALDDDVFVRTRNGMEPTALAIRLSDPIQKGLASIHAGLEQGLGFDPATSDRTFTLIMNDVGEITFLPFLLRKFSIAAPAINLRVLELGREDYEDSLDSGIADLAVGRIRLADTFRSLLLHTSSYVVVLSCDHPIFKSARRSKPSLTLKEYMMARHVAVIPRGATGNPVEKALGKHAGLRRIALTVPHTTVLPTIMPGTELLATVPDKCLDALCKDGRLRWLKLPFEVEENRVFQWWHKRQDRDTGHRWLRDQFSSLST
jgi:DNA-binding transcriptional LysR family regulator